MKKQTLKRMGTGVIAACLAVTLCTGIDGNPMRVYAQENSGDQDILIEVQDGDSIDLLKMQQGSSTRVFKADGTDGQLPDDEWAAMEAKCQSMIKQNMDCSSFASTIIAGKAGVFFSSTAGAWLIDHGYYEVGERTDLTDGNVFRDGATETIGSIRRGDVIVFTSDSGRFTHIAVAGVDTNTQEVFLYHGGYYDTLDGYTYSNQVAKSTMARYLSGSYPNNDYGDNIQIYRKASNPGADPNAVKPTEAQLIAEEGLAVRYNTHVQTYGWQNQDNKILTWDKNGETAGTSGEAKRLEAIKIKVTGVEGLGIAYNTHVQSYGWQNDVNDPSTWKKDGELSGTSGKAKRLEAIQIALTGEQAANYDVYYRVHAQTYGWLGWAKNGQKAGTASQSKRLEAIEIYVLPKGEKPATGEFGVSYIEIGKYASNQENTGMVNYMTHVQTYGNQSYVYDGSISGTQGEAKRLESVSIKLNNALTGAAGDIIYTTHVQTYGWTGDVNNPASWKKNGAPSGTTGQAKRLEAIKIMLTGEMAEKYDVYYRVHVQTYGWLDWAKNGETSGTTGLAKRLEGIQIVLVPKGGVAPGATARPCISK